MLLLQVESDFAKMQRVANIYCENSRHIHILLLTTFLKYIYDYMWVISLGVRNRNQNIVYDHRIIKMLRHARLPNLVSLFLKFKKP